MNTIYPPLLSIGHLYYNPPHVIRDQNDCKFRFYVFPIMSNTSTWHIILYKSQCFPNLPCSFFLHFSHCLFPSLPPSVAFSTFSLPLYYSSSFSVDCLFLGHSSTNCQQPSPGALCAHKTYGCRQVWGCFAASSQHQQGMYLHWLHESSNQCLSLISTRGCYHGPAAPEFGSSSFPSLVRVALPARPSHYLQ